MNDARKPRPEFSRSVAVEQLPPGGRTLSVQAEAAERAALARRFDLDELTRLEATVTLRPLGAKRGVTRVALTGDLVAETVQTCVVTLGPVVRQVSEPVHLRFSSAADAEAGEGDVEVDPETGVEDDPPDPIIAGEIDVGEALAEVLGLVIDPHPRADGAAFDAAAWVDDEDAAAAAAVADDESRAAPGPFAALAALKSRAGSE